MGELIITGLSSIACADAGALWYAKRTRACSAERCHPTKTELEQSLHLPFGCVEPVELLSSKSAPRHQSERLITRRISGDLPPNSLVKYDDGIFITSPEFFYLRRARHLSFTHALRLAMELCGGYSTLYSVPYYQAAHGTTTNPNHGSSVQEMLHKWDLCLSHKRDLMQNGYVRRDPLCTAAGLRKYVCNATSDSNRCSARKAVDWVVDGSRSPGETRMYMLACLPARYGGGRLRKPMLNRRIPLTNEAALITRSRYFEADMYWDGSKVIGEYDGRVHSDDNRRIYDDERRLALATMGYRLYTLDHVSIRDNCKVDAFIKNVARGIGQRLYPLHDSQRFAAARHRLRLHLFDYDFDLYRSTESQ